MKNNNNGKQVYTPEQIQFMIDNNLIPAPVKNSNPAKLTLPEKNSASAPVIEYTEVARKNENRLVWMIRQAIEQTDEQSLLSLCKAWIAMVDKSVPEDDKVRKLATLLPIATLTRKDFTMKEKEGKAPRFMVESTGIVKSALYTIRRCDYEINREYKKEIECPEEKQVKTKSGTTKVKMTEQEYNQYMAWKKASEKNAA